MFGLLFFFSVPCRTRDKQLGATFKTFVSRCESQPALKFLSFWNCENTNELWFSAACAPHPNHVFTPECELLAGVTLSAMTPSGSIDQLITIALYFT